MKLKSILISVLPFIFNANFSLFCQEIFTKHSDSTSYNQEYNIKSYSIPDSVLEKFPFKNPNYLNKFYPGVVSYFQNFYIRGGKNYETGFYLDGMKFNDMFTGENSFFINPDAFERIDFYNGFIPANIGNSSSGLYNYKLKTGGETFAFNVENQTDNLTFTNDVFSGKRRLGAYYYGYNETNLNIGGPLYFQNVRFFVNVNYFFQRDKNPQRYPGISNINFVDQYHQDSIRINLPAGIVPYNSFESFNFLSTLLFDFDKIKIKASGIYFDENEFTERNHILDYLNKRLGIVDRSGGVFGIKFTHEINKFISYSLNGNYYYKNDETTDQYLGSNYWDYGDSLANANVGISNFSGRYSPPVNKLIFIWLFRNSGYPSINYEKSSQTKLSFSGNINLNLFNHYIRIGGDFSKYILRNWQLSYQYTLANNFDYFRNKSSEYQDYSDEEIKNFILKFSGVNNYGYDVQGNISNSGLFKAPNPVFYSVFMDDRFEAVDNTSLYFGFRYDHYNYDYKTLIDPTNPSKTFDYQRNINENGLIATKNYSYISPKVCLKYSPFYYLSFAFDYSKNVQSHPFSDLYQGYYSIFSNIYYLQSIYGVNLGNLSPIISNQIEVDIFYKPLNNLNLLLSFFNKKIENQSSMEIMQEVPGGNSTYYQYIGSNGSTNIWGSELILSYYNAGFNIHAVLNYQNAEEETKKLKWENSILLSAPFKDVPDNVNKINLNLLLNYNFQHIYDVSDFFNNLNLSLLYSYNDGHTYRGTFSTYGNFENKSGTTPYISQVDLKIDKAFSVSQGLNLEVYIYVINLFDRKNVYDVFAQTGSTDDDGYLSSPYGSQEADALGEKFVQLYKLIELYNPNGGQQIFFGPPRQIGFGIKLNY